MTTHTMTTDRWVRVEARDTAALDALRERTGADPRQVTGRAVVDDGRFVYAPVELPVREGDRFTAVALVVAVGDGLLITVEPAGTPAFLQDAAARWQRAPASAGAHEALYHLLRACNDAAADTVDAIGAALEDKSDAVVSTAAGLDSAGRQIGVSDIATTALNLNEAEELISRTVEGQLGLARAGRHLRLRLGPEDLELWDKVELLLSDIDSLRRHAGFEHDKVRFLQQSLMTTLDVKQNQIIKVFTVVTAVFLPPTLIAAFYGQNFSVMPELEWVHGEPMVIFLTAFFGMLPLAYIKRKGWLR